MPKELILIALFGGRFLYKYDECAFLGKMKKAAFSLEKKEKFVSY